MQTIIAFKNVSFHDASHNASDDASTGVLNNISFSIKEGENIALIGESNTGKTLLLKLISGLIKPTKGEILVFGKNIHSISEKERFSLQKNMGLLFQNNALFDDMTCLDNIIFPLLRRSIPKKEAEKQARELLKQLKLENIESLYPDEISGGMKKRVAIARMMIYKPSLYLFDDPNAGLDPIISAKIYARIQSIQNPKATTLLVSQDLPSIFSLTERVLILHNKTLAFDGTQNEFQSIKNQDIKNFLRI